MTNDKAQMPNQAQRSNDKSGSRWHIHNAQAARQGYGYKMRSPQLQERPCYPSGESGLSNKVIQALGGWEGPDMVSHYAARLTFGDALQLYKQVNGSEV